MGSSVHFSNGKGNEERELLGLKWQDIRFEAGRLYVHRVLSRIPTQMPAQEHVYVEAESKTQKSQRSVMIVPFALDAALIKQAKHEKEVQ